VLCTHLTKKYEAAKVNLNNYDGLIDPGKYVQKIISIIELVKTKSDAMCKISPTTFHGSIRCGIITLNMTSS
jgi:uncharacterized membrane protein